MIKLMVSSFIACGFMTSVAEASTYNWKYIGCLGEPACPEQGKGSLETSGAIAGIGSTTVTSITGTWAASVIDELLPPGPSYPYNENKFRFTDQGITFRVGELFVTLYSYAGIDYHDVFKARYPTEGDERFGGGQGVFSEDSDIILPETSTDPDGNIIFSFNNPVIANQIIFYDPIVAVGYDYAIGKGDPNFASFILPSIGDDMFELWLFDESAADLLFKAFVSAGTEYSFGDGGVAWFRILGIETSAGLHPENPTAFVTGLSFVADGRFTGTMTPITTEVAAVPIPATLPLLGGAMMLLVCCRRARGMKRATALDIS